MLNAKYKTKFSISDKGVNPGGTMDHFVAPSKDLVSKNVLIKYSSSYKQTLYELQIYKNIHFM